MPIGDGPDYYIGINEDEERIMALADKIDNWWDSLDDNLKFELLEPYYSDKLNLMGVDEAWDTLDWDDKVNIWDENNEDNKN